MRFILLFALTLLTAINLNAYSYAAAGKEPTIESKEAILKAINSDDFENAKIVFDKYEKNYRYLNDEFNNNLFKNLEDAIKNQKKELIIKWLNISTAIEIERRLDGGLKNIKEFNVAKVMLAKANKFYKILSPFLDEEKNNNLSQALKNCIEAIGNPGLFGVGAKPYDIEKYKLNQELVVKILKSL